MPLLIIGFKGNRVISKISKDFVRHGGMLAHQEPLSILGENLLPLNTSITIETEKSAESVCPLRKVCISIMCKAMFRSPSRNSSILFRPCLIYNCIRLFKLSLCYARRNTTVPNTLHHQELKYGYNRHI